MLYFASYIESKQIKLGKTIAIVGNSRNILDNKNGKDIDDHDKVIRFN